MEPVFLGPGAGETITARAARDVVIKATAQTEDDLRVARERFDLAVA